MWMCGDRGGDYVRASPAISSVQRTMASGEVHEKKHQAAWTVSCIQRCDCDSFNLNGVARLERLQNLLLRSKRGA